MASKPSIGGVPRSAVGTDREPFDRALKETLEVITGRRGAVIEPLAAGASLDDVVRKLNEIIARLQ